MKIDEIDAKLLTALTEDASISVPKLSKKIKVNPSVCYSRIKRLVRRGYIKKFTIVASEELLGYHVTALVGLNIDVKKRANILNNITALAETRSVEEVTGRFDILVTIKARSLDDMHSIVTEKIGSIDGVNKSETFIELKIQQKEPIFEEQASLGRELSLRQHNGLVSTSKGSHDK
ncbi:MAG: Lrp/AsnC family transcriptional regulator [Thaumarchaeota archaeon]|nr:Lrp/AsnC family transcriptional regulator [Nitrososphaerota archaeon]MCL5317119.1 Lrp/AsnC family transcriptional regulator [Nitrososphaerota archaeon]